MNDMNIHGVKNIKADRIQRLNVYDGEKTFVRHIRITTNETVIEFSLFTNNKDSLKILDGRY